MTDMHIGTQIAQVRKLYASTFSDGSISLGIYEQLEQHARAIFEAHQNGDEAVTFHLGSWCPGLVSMSAAEIMSTHLKISSVYESIAREYGFTDWQQVNALGDLKLDYAFESAVECVIFGAVEALQNQIKANPMLPLERSRFGHNSTLLHYLGANGVESHRQITPLNAATVAQCLIEAGADVNAPANMYGGGSTTLGLVTSSAHPENAGVVDAIVAVLKEAGAKE